MPTVVELLANERADVYRMAKGSIHLWRPARSLLVSRVEGVLSVDGSRAIEVATRRIVSEDHRVDIFHDWSEMTDYEIATRVQLTLVAAELLGQIDSLHLLVRSKIVAMGVQTANLVLKKIIVHPTPDAFAHRLHEMMQKHRRG